MVLGDQEMILVQYTIWDSKADAYITPFFSVNDEVAIRSFSSACTDEGHDFYRHAEDYTLFRVATFNQADGDTILENMTVIARAHELKEKANGL